jgi:DNA polymerase-4
MGEERECEQANNVRKNTNVPAGAPPRCRCQHGRVRSEPSILHLDLDAFFAAVEQRDKPSLRGRPVIVGGLGPRGVVATASYEARVFGVGSAMPMGQARALCPHAAFLTGRFGAYREVSGIVMGLLAELSPALEPISLDEAFVDLAAGTPPAGDVGWDVDAVRLAGGRLKDAVHAATGLRASVGAGTSKLIAKIASDLDKPDGLVVIAPGTEAALLNPMPVTRLWSVGPATADRLRRAGVHTVAELAATDPDELIGLVGQAHGRLLTRLARADDDRPVSSRRESKSISVEDTFDRDVVERAVLVEVCDRMAARVCRRLVESGLSGRTVTLKIRRHDFVSLTRSATLAGPTDDMRVVTATARRLLTEIDTTDGIRLLGVGISGLSDWSQEDLFAAAEAAEAAERALVDEGPRQPAGPEDPPPDARPRWTPGQDVRHGALGDGWVWGAGLGRVTVRFETRHTDPGPVRTFRADDPSLTPRHVDVPTT